MDSGRCNTLSELVSRLVSDFKRYKLLTESGAEGQARLTAQKQLERSHILLADHRLVCATCSDRAGDLSDCSERDATVCDEAECAAG